jgi:hypothetical protein
VSPHRAVRNIVERTGTPLDGYRWPQAIIVRAVRRYCSYRLSAADGRDRLAERGVEVSARTILSWVHTTAAVHLRGEQSPGDPAPQHEHDARERGAVGDPGPPAFGLRGLGRQQRCADLPECVADRWLAQAMATSGPGPPGRAWKGILRAVVA